MSLCLSFTLNWGEDTFFNFCRVVIRVEPGKKGKKKKVASSAVLKGKNGEIGPMFSVIYWPGLLKCVPMTCVIP